MTNFFFNNNNSSNEQELFESLVIESISIYGIDALYIPRNIGKLDKIYTEDDQSYYTNTFMIDMYVNSVDGFVGDGNFMSKFGLEIRDQIILTVANRSFNDKIGQYMNFTRPREGDLVYFPLNKKVFTIKYVNPFDLFFSLGKLPISKLTCELFEYSNEVFNTGIPEIDIIQKKYSTNIIDNTLNNESDITLTDELNNIIEKQTYSTDNIIGTGTNDTFDYEASKVIDFNILDPWNEEGEPL